MSNCNLNSIRPSTLEFINSQNVLPGDIIEIDYVYSDGYESNITLDDGYDPLNSLLTNLSFSNILSASLGSNPNLYYRNSSLTFSRDELICYVLCLRDAAYSSNDFTIDVLIDLTAQRMINNVGTLLYGFLVNDVFLSRFGIKNSQIISRKTLYDIFKLLHNMGFVNIPVYNGTDDVETFKQFNISFDFPLNLYSYNTNLLNTPPLVSDVTLVTFQTDGKISSYRTVIDYNLIPPSRSEFGSRPISLLDPTLPQAFVTKSITLIQDKFDTTFDDFNRPVRYEIFPSELQFSSGSQNHLNSLASFIFNTLQDLTDRGQSLSVYNLVNSIQINLNNKLSSELIWKYGGVISPFTLKELGWFDLSNRRAIIESFVLYMIQNNVLIITSGSNLTDYILLPAQQQVNQLQLPLILTNTPFQMPSFTRRKPIINIPVDEQLTVVKFILYLFNQQSASLSIDIDEFKRFLNPEEQLLVDEYFIFSLIETLMITSVLTAISADNISFTDVNLIDSYPEYEFKKLRFYFNVSLLEILFAVTNDQLNITDLGNLLSGGISNLEQPGRFEIQKLTSYIKRFQNTNFIEDDLPMYSFWNTVDEQQFFNFGITKTPTSFVTSSNTIERHISKTGKMGKLVLRVINSNPTVASSHITDPHVWANKSFKLNHQPFNHPTSSRYIQAISFWTNKFKSLNNTDPVRLSLDPNYTTTNSFRVIGLKENDTLFFSGILPFGMSVSGSFMFNHSLASINSQTHSIYPLTGISESLSIPVNIGSSSIAPYFQMVGFQPLFALSYDGKQLFDFVNYTQSLVPNTISNSSQRMSFSRDQRFNSYNNDWYDGYQSVVYRIRKWPAIVISNKDMTVDLLKYFNIHTFGLKHNLVTESIQQSYFIDDKLSGYSSSSINQTFVDFVGNNIEISSSYNVHRNSIFNLKDLYVGGCYTNRPLQTFSVNAYNKVTYKQLFYSDPVTSYGFKGFQHQFTGYPNIIQSTFTLDIGNYFDFLIDTRWSSNDAFQVNYMIERIIQLQNGYDCLLTNYNLQNFIFHIAELIKTLPSGSDIYDVNIQQFIKNNCKGPSFIFGSEIISNNRNQLNELNVLSGSLTSYPFWVPSRRKLSLSEMFKELDYIK